MDVGYNFVSQGFVFTEPVLGLSCNVFANFPINPRGA